MINDWKDKGILEPARSKDPKTGEYGSSLFLMGKMLFQFIRIGFCDDIHTKQRRAANIDISRGRQPP